MIQFDYYFSKGLKPPTSIVFIFFMWQFFCWAIFFPFYDSKYEYIFFYCEFIFTVYLLQWFCVFSVITCFFLKQTWCQLNKNTLNTSFFQVTQLDTPNGSHKLSPRKGHLDKIPKWVTTGRTWYAKTFATRVSMDVIVNSLEVGLFHLFTGRLTAYF